MRIAQVVPLHESVPPKKYGGTERVAATIIDAILDTGKHEVILYASAESESRAELRPARHRSLRCDPNHPDPLPSHYRMFEQIARDSDFDVIHFHTDFLHFPWARRMAIPSLTTLHGRLDISELKVIYEEYPDLPLVSISDSQRAPLPDANWVRTIYHGLPKDLYQFNPSPQGYLAFLGRFTPEKRAEWAIRIALEAGYPIKLAAKIDAHFVDYYEAEIAPLLKEPGVEFLGEIDDREKQELLGNAYATLLPIDWPEPFGLVMIESMACGTPVIAFRRGSVPELISPGVTGYIVDDIPGAVEAVTQIGQLKRINCRREFDRRFTASRMADDYLNLYQKILDFEALPSQAA